MQKELINYAIPELFFNYHTIDCDASGSLRDLHLHSAVEIVKVHSGSVRCRVVRDELELSAGELLLINKRVAHKLMAANAVFSYIQVDVSPYVEGTDDGAFEYLGGFLLGKNRRAYQKFAADSELGALWSRLTAKFNRDPLNGRRYIKAYLFELVAIMFSHSLLSEKTELSAAQAQLIAPIVGYIDAHFASHITLEQLSAEAGYNKYAVCHNFKKITGATVFEYINYVRICYACRLMKRKRVISEIAAESGFASAAYFSKAFKKEIGCSPSVYMNNLRL